LHQLILPFFYESKLAFHLGLIEKGNGKYDILTNIPRQILDANYWTISKLELEKSLRKRSEEQYLKSIAEIIIDDAQAHSFFYSNFIDLREFEIRKSFEEITNSKSNLIMIPETVYSRFNEQTRFYILCSLYTSIKTFEPDFFFENVPLINRLEFEKAIPNGDSQLLYVDFFDRLNEFRLIDDGEFNVFFLLKKEVPKMIIVKHV
jgi:hypothetical protein